MEEVAAAFCCKLPVESILAPDVQTTYFATFLLGERQDDAPPKIDAVLEALNHWLFNNPARPLVKQVGWPFASAECSNPDKSILLKALRLVDGDRDNIIATRYQHPDGRRAVPRTWRTDCVLDLRDTTATRFSITVAAGELEDGITPVRAPTSRPRIVKELINKFGARESGFPVKTKFVNIADDEGMRVMEFLLNPERRLPVVFVSRTNRDNVMYCAGIQANWRTGWRASPMYLPVSPTKQRGKRASTITVSIPMMAQYGSIGRE